MRLSTKKMLNKRFDIVPARADGYVCQRLLEDLVARIGNKHSDAISHDSVLSWCQP